MRKIRCTVLALLVTCSTATFAQDARPQPPPGGHRPPPPPPIIGALDANRDGIIDANEIANASAALRALDLNGDGRISGEELRPPCPRCAHGNAGAPTENNARAPRRFSR